MTLTIPDALYTAWLAADAAFRTAMATGPESTSPYVKMSTAQIDAVKQRVLAGMAVLVSVREGSE